MSFRWSLRRFSFSSESSNLSVKLVSPTQNASLSIDCIVIPYLSITGTKYVQNLWSLIDNLCVSWNQKEFTQIKILFSHPCVHTHTHTLIWSCFTTVSYHLIFLHLKHPSWKMPMFVSLKIVSFFFHWTLGLWYLNSKASAHTPKNRDWMILGERFFTHAKHFLRNSVET